MSSAADRPNRERAPSRSRVWSASLCLVLIAGLTLIPALAAHAASLVVTDPGDSGPNTLRQAILTANATPGPDVITFNIGGGGGAISATIVPTSPLPAITDTTTVDGLSQPGSSCAAWPPTLLIRIDGSSAGAEATGLTVAGGDGTTIRGLVIRRFQGDGLSISSPATTTSVTCDAFGTNPNGTGQFGNGGAGIAVRSTGAGAGASIVNNVIMNSGGPGVLVDPGARVVSIRGNRIDVNGGVGIDLVAANGDPNGDGPTPNTVAGPGLGGNDLQFTPMLATAVTGPTGTTVSGSLTTTAAATASGQYVIDLYSNASCDASPAPGGFGEGAAPIGSVSIPATDTSGPGTFAFTVTGITGVSLGRFVTATASDGSGAGNTSEFSACAQVVAASSTPSANLSMTGTPSPDPATGGGSITYGLTVHNAGPDPANDVSVTDNLPAGVQLASMSASAGSCSATDSTVTCSLGTVNAGVSNDAKVTIVATTDDVTSATSLVDQASVTSSTADPVASDNQITVTSTVQPRAADLSITKTGPETVTAGDTFSYAIAVADAGPDDAHEVTVTDPLPAGESFVEATPSAGCTQSAGTVTCDLGALAAGDSTSFDLKVRADPFTGTDPVVLSNVASVASDRTDPSPDDDTSPAVLTTVTPVAADPDLELTSVANVPNPVTGGYDLGYSTTITNLGPGDATGVVLSDTLAPGESFVTAGSDPSCAVTAGVVSCAIGPLLDGATKTIQIVTKTPVVAADTAMPDAFAVTSPQDITPANDAKTVTTTVRPRGTDFAAAYVPPSPGPTWVTDATIWFRGDPVATSTDPTIVQVGIPGGGPGGPVTITERPCGTPFVCAVRRSTNGNFFPAPGGVFGSLVTITVPHGYGASNPFGAVITDDWSVAGFGWGGFKVSSQDGATGAFTAQLPSCWSWQHGTPPPCVASIGRFGAWWSPWSIVDLRTALLFTADATFGRGR